MNQQSIAQQSAVNRPRTALVLSAGAMYGSYQAGVWQALAEREPVDLVIGASVGSLNGWAIAGGIRPQELADRWLHLEPAGRFRLRWPQGLRSGFLDAGYLAEWVQDIFAAYRPRCRYGAVLTRLRPFRPELFTDDDITWHHLAGSCAMPFLYPHYQFDGVTYTDGGLMQALPLWAAERMGCERIIAVNLVPQPPIPGARHMSRWMRRVSGHHTKEPQQKVIRITPPAPLGTMRDFMIWQRGNAERWIEQGYRDTERALAASLNR